MSPKSRNCDICNTPKTGRKGCRCGKYQNKVKKSFKEGDRVINLGVHHLPYMNGNVGKLATVVEYSATLGKYGVIYDDGSVGIGEAQYYDLHPSPSVTVSNDAREKVKRRLHLDELKSSIAQPYMPISSSQSFDNLYKSLMNPQPMGSGTTQMSYSQHSTIEIGDEVRYTASVGPTGMIGIVIRIGDDDNKAPDAIGVKYEGFNRGHNLEGRLPITSQEGWYGHPDHIELVEKGSDFKPVPEKKKPIDEKALEALVLEASVKKEIMAVLKQHENSDKLFNEWGLGETIEYGRGMSLMFWGGPGTGKTWGAHCIAKALGTTLLQISAAEIQSSEPGASERNLQEAFKTAKEEGKVLFLDECDSLITTRADLGMVLAAQVNCLLTEIEKFEGVVILATNRIETMDEALERRLALIVEFPFPKYAQRVDIWKKLLPTKLPLAEGLTAEVLAQPKFSGGQIKNIILQAARLAISEGQENVTKENFDAAVTRLNKSKGIMGQLARTRTGRPFQDMEVGVSSNVQIDRKVDLDTFLEEDKEDDTK